MIRLSKINAFVTEFVSITQVYSMQTTVYVLRNTLQIKVNPSQKPSLQQDVFVSFTDIDDVIQIHSFAHKKAYDVCQKLQDAYLMTEEKEL